MTVLRLLTASDCHLCERGRRVLDEMGVAWREVDADSEEGRELAASAPPLRPVLYADDARVLAYGRLSIRRLGKTLGAMGEAVPS